MSSLQVESPGARDTGRPPEVVLEARHVTLRYGSVVALDDVSFTVRKGEVVALVGPNGAGKTSMFNCISAFSRPTEGSLSYGDLDLGAARRHEIAAAGVGRMFQNLSLFPGSTVMENALVGRHTLMRGSVAGNLLRWRHSRQQDLQHRAAVAEILGLLDLYELRNTPVGELPYGTRKRVELARALASEPRLLLMDEPVAGMNPAETAELTTIVSRIRQERDISILVVEHDMSMVMAVADWITVLDFGHVIAEGRPSDIQQDPRVRAAYLGTADEPTTED